MPQITVTANLKSTTKRFARYEYNGPEGIVNAYRPLDKLPDPPPQTYEVTLNDPEVPRADA